MTVGTATKFNALIDRLVAVADKSKEFKRRELHGVEQLRLDVKAALAAASDGQITPEELKDRIVLARFDAHKRLGAPGDFGYESPEGEAMRELYNFNFAPPE